MMTSRHDQRHLPLLGIRCNGSNVRLWGQNGPEWIVESHAFICRHVVINCACLANQLNSTEHDAVSGTPAYYVEDKIMQKKVDSFITSDTQKCRVVLALLYSFRIVRMARRL